MQYHILLYLGSSRCTMLLIDTNNLISNRYKLIIRKTVYNNNIVYYLKFKSKYDYKKNHIKSFRNDMDSLSHSSRGFSVKI